MRRIKEATDGRQQEATTPEPKARPQGTSRRQKQREATGGNDPGAESEATGTNCIRLG